MSLSYSSPSTSGVMLTLCLLLHHHATAIGQEAEKSAKPSTDEIRALEESARALSDQVEELTSGGLSGIRDADVLLADVAIFGKAAEWMLRFQEFHKPEYAGQLREVLKRGVKRAEMLAAGAPDWTLQPGTTVRGYVSRVDGSLQPYAITLPEGIQPADAKRLPLHVVLHGRADQMNEVNFIYRMDGKPLRGEKDQNWIQLDVYGRGNNAFRFAGETDVFEAMDDVRRRYRIDEDRVTLHGFSMGGAGAWHLGMHFPDVWSSVGPGAGFVDFYRYQKKDPENPLQRLPDTQHRTLRIYDSVNYALNAFNVPVCTYGGENDPQLLASTTMRDAAAESGVDIRVIVGPGMGHAFDPQSQKQFMAFHREHSDRGRPAFGQRKEIRFTTHSLRYNRCDWLTIEEVEQVYEPATVDAQINDSGDVEITTMNVAALRLVRDVATDAIIDGTVLECRGAADGLLPDVYYVKNSDGWEGLDYQTSRNFSNNPQRQKRSGLQGPIDDAFMSSFVCVRGTGAAWNPVTQEWADFTLNRFDNEFAQWMRGDIRIVEDSAVDQDIIRNHHLVLFGDPGSNSVLRRIVDLLPVKWSATAFSTDRGTWSTSEHGMSLIYPNPLNPSRYVVINSGHTFHEKDFRSSNAWLFPRLGDIAVQKIVKTQDGGFDETLIWSDIFDSSWRLPSR